MQSPMRGSTYITKWDINNNFNPVESKVVCDVTCGPLEYSESFKTLALGSSDGRLIFVDAQ